MDVQEVKSSSPSPADEKSTPEAAEEENVPEAESKPQE